MKNYVEGQLTGQEQKLNEGMKNKLQSLGYQMNGSKFCKYGQVEAIVNELVPYVEKEGINAFQSLYLEEFTNEGKLVGKYDQGRVIRYEN